MVALKVLFASMALTGLTAGYKDDRHRGDQEYKSPMMCTISKTAELKIKIGDRLIEEPIVVGLMTKDAPRAARKFFQLCTEGEIGPNGDRVSYTGTKFYHILPRMLMKAGHPPGSLREGSLVISEEHAIRVRHEEGVLAMVEEGPEFSGGSFFITTKATSYLDGKHIVFGSVMRGMDTVYEIEKAGSATGKPQQEVTIVECRDPYAENETSDN